MTAKPVTSTAAAPAWEFEAYNSPYKPGMAFKAAVKLATKEDAAAFAATLPKGLKATAGPLSGLADAGGWWEVGLVTVYANLFPTKATGSVNEAGAKRWKSFRQLVKAKGWSLTYAAGRYGNSLPEPEAMAFVAPT